MSLTDFAGRSVLVTGAGGGLGRAIRVEMAGRGAAIIAADQSDAALAEVAPDTRCVFDLADRAASADAARTLVATGRVPDILINNAGWTRAETFGGMTSETASAEIDINLTGVTAFTLPIVAAMAARGHGVVVFISSVNALSHFGNPAYSAAKAGINGLTRALAVEYGRMGVRANAVCPGSIRTPAWDHRIARDASIPQKLARHYPLGRIVTADEVARTVAFLASEAASGITGVCLPVDAGLTAGMSAFISDILEG